jgi:hypothetical protein
MLGGRLHVVSGSRGTLYGDKTVLVVKTINLLEALVRATYKFLGQLNL